ncbi:MAG: prepilin peptidase [Deltaproteobacteria bacterium]|nr:prepilin peptidase [Deltaproteobacteria bacterium]
MFYTPVALGYFFAGFFGLCVGSFLNVVICRVPKGESIVKPRSHCPQCDHLIAWYDNIPLLSFLVLKAKCRHCKTPIPIQYFGVELLTCLLSLLCYAWFHTLLLYFAWFCLLVAPLVAVIFIDLEHRIIPDSISLPGILAGVLVHFIDSPPDWEKQALIESGLGILAGGGFLFLIAWGYEKIKKREGLGGGDIKLAAMLGAFFGWQAVLMILLMASILGSIIGLLVISIKKDWDYALPFGPFLAISAYLQLFLGQPILQWYLSLFH